VKPDIAYPNVGIENDESSIENTWLRDEGEKGGDDHPD
jgi:hypothetical protein